MNFFIKFLDVLDNARLDESPHSFGTFHFICLAICIAFTVFVCIRMKDCDERAVRIVLFCIWALVVVLETIKQFLFAYDGFENGAAVWDYAWYAFPFQFCSAIFYSLPFVVFLKEGKVRDAFIFFSAFYLFFGGVCVFAYPETCYVDLVFINLQTMVHHGLQIVVGALLMVRYREKLNIGNWAKSLIVFAAFLAVAMALNLTVPGFIDGDTFNMFFISPYFPCTLPVMEMFYSNLPNSLVPYPVFLCIYIFGFALVGFIIYNVARGIYKASQKKKA